MAKKTVYIMSFLFFATLPLFGQVVDGYVFDEIDSTAIANVLVKVDNNSELFALTDSHGYFKLDSVALKDSHIISMSHISFNSLTTKLTSNGTTYYLKPKYEMLNEVVVESNWIYRKDGMGVVDFGKMKMEQNLQLSDALRHIPGIVKNSNGNYSLGGKNAVIYVNNVKQNISPQSLEAFLESLPANIVANIELTFVNSGKYSASTEAVININTKSNIPLGQSVQPYAFTSIFPHGMYDTGGNIFYMVKKSRWLYNGTLSFANERIYKPSTDSLSYNGLKILDDHNFSDGRNNVFTYRGSTIYEFTNKSKLSLNAFVYYDKGSADLIWNNYNINQYTANKHAHSDLYNISLSYTLPSINKRTNGHLTYAFSYGNDNSKLDYLAKDEVYKSSDLRMSGYMNTFNIDLNSEVKSFLFSYGLQVDYNKVKDHVIYSHVNMDRNDVDESFSGHEVLTGLYAQAKYTFSKRVSTRLGLRMENTQYTYSSTTNNNSNHYVNFFPSLLTYINMNNYNSIIGIVSNINRPKYSWMVYGERQANDMVSMYGNRDLKPNKAYGFVIYNTLFKYMNLNFSYILTYDFIGNIFSSNGKHLSSTYQNIADLQTFKTNIVIPYRFADKKVMGQFQFNLAYDKLYNFKNQFSLPANRKCWYVNYNIHSNISYSPASRIYLSIDGNYYPTYKSSLMNAAANGSLDFELQYMMLKEKNLQLRLTLNDVFARDAKRVFYYVDGQYYSYQRHIGPIFRLSLKYVFNKGQRVVDEYRDYTPSNGRLR